MKVIVRDISKREITVAMDADDVHRILLRAALDAAGADMCDLGTVSIRYEPAIVSDTGEDGVMATATVTIDWTAQPKAAGCTCE